MCCSDPPWVKRNFLEFIDLIFILTDNGKDSMDNFRICNGIVVINSITYCGIIIQREEK